MLWYLALQWMLLEAVLLVTSVSAQGPWLNCKAPINCSDVFRDNECNPDCDNSACLFDGFDCEKKVLPCSPHYDTYCLKNYGNDYCDPGCNNEECNWDGLDCETELPMLADESLVAVVLMETEEFLKKSVSLLREIGSVLRTNVKIKKDGDGKQMVYPWKKKTNVTMEIYLRCMKTDEFRCLSPNQAANFLTAFNSIQPFSIPVEEFRAEVVMENLHKGPWLNCRAPINCSDVFHDKVCNPECDNSACLFDGFDCKQKVFPCSEHYDTYCLKNYGNGYCDYGCNNEECNWDGLDCETELPPMLADGSLMAVVLMEPEEFLKNFNSFLREMGFALGTNVKIKKDENGKQMVHPWQSKTNVTIEVDNVKCKMSQEARCFSSSTEAANFLTAVHMKKGFSIPIQEFRRIDVENRKSFYDPSSSTEVEEASKEPCNSKFRPHLILIYFFRK